MKTLERTKTPDGIDIRLDDWSKNNTPEFPDLYGYQIVAYPIAKNNSVSGWIKSGEIFVLIIPYNPTVGYTNDDVLADFEALKSGAKQIRDLSTHFYNGEKDKWLLGMESAYDEQKIWR